MDVKPLDLRSVLASRARNIFAYRINFDAIGYDNLPKMKEWCEANCKSIWDCHHTYALYFRFEDEQDATMFMLRWGTANGNKLK